MLRTLVIMFSIIVSISNTNLIDAFIPSNFMSTTLVWGNHVLCIKIDNIDYQPERGYYCFQMSCGKWQYLYKTYYWIAWWSDWNAVWEVFVNKCLLEEPYISVN